MATALAARSATGRGRKTASPTVVEQADDTPRRQNQRRVDQPGSGEDVDLNTVGGRIAWARLREEMTQEQVAKAIDKVRPTVVQYEANKIVPPIEVIQKMAKYLKVSPSFLAFGEHGIQTNGNAGEDVVNIDEISYGRDGSYQSGVFAFPRKLAESYVEKASTFKAFVMNHHAPLFDLRAGDRVFADTSVRDVTNEHDTYLLDVTGGMEIVRIPRTLTKGPNVEIILPDNEKMSVKVKDLKIIGAVVSTLRSK